MLATDTRTWLLARSATLRERVRRVRHLMHRHGGRRPREPSDATIILENHGILHGIETTANRELAEVEIELAAIVRAR
jgi:hypothetical protein